MKNQLCTEMISRNIRSVPPKHNRRWYYGAESISVEIILDLFPFLTSPERHHHALWCFLVIFRSAVHVTHSSLYCASALFLTLNTTGTDVQGTIPISVIAMSTRSDGVTSYTRFKRYNDFISRHDDKISGLSGWSSRTKSSGSPNGRKFVSS